MPPFASPVVVMVQLLNIKDGIKDQLAGVVGSCAAASADFNHVDIFFRESVRLCQQFICALAGTERNDRGVFGD